MINKVNQFGVKTAEGVNYTGDSATSILDSAQNNNINFEYSCKNGQCGVEIVF
jgi:ferredoxin